MRLIDADVMRTDWLENGQNEYVYDTNAVLNSIDEQPTIDAEPVRHTENTTVIDTNDASKWKSRIMICERNSHWGRLYYESDTKYGHWVPIDEEIPCDEWNCTACGERRTFVYPMDFDEMKELYKYCPNCGAKMK